MIALAWIVGLLLLLAVCAYHRLPLLLATLLTGGYLALAAFLHLSLAGMVALGLVFALVAIPLNLPPLRRALISDRLLSVFRKLLPPMSDTEREALDAGTVWWDAELFSGKPRWKTLLGYPAPTLSPEEKAFVDGPVDELCKMLDDWDITHHRLDLPPEAWRFLKEKGFLGMIIPKQYGGLGFSALAHSEVVMKLATRSTTAAVTCMVPNSLGPAELLLHYGTDAQRNHYLPRLARGEEIPCFALTGPEAGSDAGSMPDVGIVCKGEWEGKEVLGLRLTWEKRYITLGPVATLLGLAFKVYDPNRLLGGEVERGITLALIPTNTPGVNIGRRHFPLNVPFQNGPNWGKDVFIPMDYIIGGQPMIGRGWMMLMNCLSVGRAISLPSSGTAGAKVAALTAGAYARVRQQFKVPVGEFEGVQEQLARIGGNAYLMDATRRMTALAVDQGEKPSVLSAIAKYHLTERARICVDAAMDVHGGRGICLGPRNYLARGYQGMPVSITVEGANILTRNMIIFGQGAIRCHPFLLKEVTAAQNGDRARGAKDFDKALFGHAGFLASNLLRSFWLGLTGARLVRVPGARETRRHFQRLTRMSAAFALVADTALLLLGGALKRKEFVSARLGDLLSYLYLGSATLKHFHDQGEHDKDLPLVDWAMEDTLHRLQETLTEVLRNFPSPALGFMLRAVVFPWGRRYRAPGDRLTSRAARLLLEPSETRERLTQGCFTTLDRNDPIGRVEFALRRVIAAEPLEKQLAKAIRAGELRVGPMEDPLDKAEAAGILTDDEVERVREARRARRDAIMVDDFSNEELLRGPAVNA